MLSRLKQFSVAEYKFGWIREQIQASGLVGGMKKPQDKLINQVLIKKKKYFTGSM